jgi:D-alanyl-lipoteichoic acid acyltransferase DltB (MBOAT superfamily)
VARGSAALFGYKVPINFNLPFLANNIANCLHRWHISLSTWLRDYLYIPWAVRVVGNGSITAICF